MLTRAFRAAHVPFHGAHAFRRSWAIRYADRGNVEDLKELGGWESYAMVDRYRRRAAGERARVNARKIDLWADDE